jgi:RimJ/RimL family protein N-acetyltransferase
MLHGERVTLRAVERDDLPFLHALVNDLDTQWLVSEQPPVPTSLAALEAEFDRSASDGSGAPVRFTVEVDGERVGRCVVYAIDRYSRNCRIGVTLARESRGRGLGSDVVRSLLDYCFRVLDMHKVALESLATNEAGLATWKSCGFVEEARLREHAWYEGRYVEMVHMGILRSEWAASRPA